MGFLLSKEKEAGLDQLPDGRWVYTPVNILGQRKNHKKYLVNDTLKERILRTYNIFKYFGILCAVFLVQYISRNYWKFVLVELLIIAIACILFNYKFNAFSKNCEEIEGQKSNEK